MAYDLIIKNGRVIDGSGEPGFYADVAVKDGRIAGIGKFNESATRVIDADGRVVSPGWIDNHTHYDAQAVFDPICYNSARNGHTTAIVGNCGLSIAPAREDDPDFVRRMFSGAERVPIDVLRTGVDVFLGARLRLHERPDAESGYKRGNVDRPFRRQALCHGRRL